MQLVLGVALGLKFLNLPKSFQSANTDRIKMVALSKGPGTSCFCAFSSQTLPFHCALDNDVPNKKYQFSYNFFFLPVTLGQETSFHVGCEIVLPTMRSSKNHLTYLNLRIWICKMRIMIFVFPILPCFCEIIDAKMFQKLQSIMKCKQLFIIENQNL